MSCVFVCLCLGVKTGGGVSSGGLRVRIRCFPHGDPGSIPGQKKKKKKKKGKTKEVACCLYPERNGFSQKRHDS